MLDQTAQLTNDFKPGFASLLMHKDLSLAMSAANDKNVDFDLGK